LRILAVDPGPHVGCALLHEDGSMTCWEDTPEHLYASALEWAAAVDVIVCEDFHISGARSKHANETIEMIGVLRYVAQQKGKQFVTQSPSTALAFVGKKWEKLKRMGWYAAGPDHKKSASAHLLYYVVQQRIIDPSRVLTSASGEEVSPSAIR
jgi:hypothetical protein